MTVAVAVKVFDGVVLAADSATTFTMTDANGTVADRQVYNNANKVFQLHRKKPLGAMTWGKASIGPASIATLAKDFRQRITGNDPDHAWTLPDTYSVESVVERFVEMMYDELYDGLPDDQKGVLGFFLSGCAGMELEAWKIQFDQSGKTVERVAEKDDCGWYAYAQPEATVRLFNGVDPSLASLLTQGNQTAQVILDKLKVDPVMEGMPFADAIGLAEFMVNTTIGFRRYLPGADTVGGPVEIAAISRHEGFKWVSRKHYYPPHLNPEDPHP